MPSIPTLRQQADYPDRATGASAVKRPCPVDLAPTFRPGPCANPAPICANLRHLSPIRATHAPIPRHSAPIHVAIAPFRALPSEPAVLQAIVYLADSFGERRDSRNRSQHALRPVTDPGRLIPDLSRIINQL